MHICAQVLMYVRKSVRVCCRWQISEPGDCSAVCGPGEAHRPVSCVRFHLGADSEVDESLCLHPKPSERVPCVVDVCPIGWETHGKVKQKGKTQTLKMFNFN